MNYHQLYYEQASLDFTKFKYLMLETSHIPSCMSRTVKKCLGLTKSSLRPVFRATLDTPLILPYFRVPHLSYPRLREGKLGGVSREALETVPFNRIHIIGVRDRHLHTVFIKK